MTLFAQTKGEQLAKASYDGDLATVKTLLKVPGINVNTRYNGDTALVGACEGGYLDIVKELLAHDDIDVDKTDNLDATPLIVASIGGYTDIVKELLKHSPKLNKRDDDGYTALMWAAKKGYQDIVHELLVNGADVTKVQKTKPTYNLVGPDFDGINSALLLAYNNNHRDIAMEILKFKDTTFPEYYNAIDRYGNTILILAARHGDIEIVNTLLNLNKEQTEFNKILNFGQKMVNINKSDSNGNTPLMLAAKYGHLDVVEALLNQPEIELHHVNIFHENVYQLATKKEIKDAIIKHPKSTIYALRKAAEEVEKRILEGTEKFEFNK